MTESLKEYTYQSSQRRTKRRPNPNWHTYTVKAKNAKEAKIKAKQMRGLRSVIISAVRLKRK
jgi:ribosomal protein L28